TGRLACCVRVEPIRPSGRSRGGRPGVNQTAVRPTQGQLRAPKEGQRSAVAELLRASPVAAERASGSAEADHQLYLDRGRVHDALLGRLSSDLDFTTDARPERIQMLVSGWAEAVWDTGIEFGTVGAAKGGVQLEITTFRADVYARVSRNPEVSFGDTIEG